MDGQAIAGWYPDPQNRQFQRYWSGSAWTNQVQPSGPPQQVVYVQQAGNGLAVAGLVTGIVGLVLGLIPILFFLAWALGITGFIFGLVARGKAKRNPAVGRKTMATWAIVLGVGAFAMGCAGYAIVNDAFSDLDRDLNATSSCLDRADTLSEMEDC